MATRRRALGKVDNFIDQKVLHPEEGKKGRPYSYFGRKIASFPLLLTAVLSFHYIFISTSTLTRETTVVKSSSINTSSPISQRPLKCTMEQLMKVRSQLSPEMCIDNHVNSLNFIQKCTITTATKCPKASWIDQYYRERYNQYYESSPGSLANNEKSSFLGISIGCNKGFDAINTLRMGTFDESINKSLWKRAMTDNGKNPLAGSVCKQDRAEDIFQIPKSPDISAAGSTNNQKDSPRGEMHCVEPMPATYKMLSKSAENLGYTQKGFKVTHAAVSKQSGEMLFSSVGKVGVENRGLATCQRGKKKSLSNSTDCVTVPVYSLKEFVQKKVKADKSDPINMLSIDVEGFDGDV
jgi:FkbM family methyltransferase